MHALYAGVHFCPPLPFSPLTSWTAPTKRGQALSNRDTQLTQLTRQTAQASATLLARQQSPQLASHSVARSASCRRSACMHEPGAVCAVQSRARGGDECVRIKHLFASRHVCSCLIWPRATRTECGGSPQDAATTRLSLVSRESAPVRATSQRTPTDITKTTQHNQPSQAQPSPAQPSQP
jgi:hypothetical protein